MDQKIKFIMFGLIGLLIVVFGLFTMNLVSKQQQLVQERDTLKGSLESKIADLNNLEKKVRALDSEKSTLNRQIEQLNQDKQDLQKRYELVNKAKDELVEKLKSQTAQPTASASAQQLQALPANTDAYWAGILKAKTDLEMQLASIRNELKTLQISNEQLQREKSTLDLDVNTLRRDKDDLKRQFDYNQKLMDSIAQDLVRERTDKMQIQESFKAIKSENMILTRQLKSLNSRKTELEKRIQDIQAGKSTVEGRFTEMESMLTSKISQINELKEELDAIRSGRGSVTAPVLKRESVELPPIVVRPGKEGLSKSPQSSLANLSGKVVGINKENNFVIVDIGEEGGLKVGDSLNVFRQDDKIASVEVIKVGKNASACDIKKQNTPIKEGDTAR